MSVPPFPVTEGTEGGGVVNRMSLSDFGVGHRNMPVWVLRLSFLLRRVVRTGLERADFLAIDVDDVGLHWLLRNRKVKSSLLCQREGGR